MDLASIQCSSGQAAVWGGGRQMPAALVCRPRGRAAAAAALPAGYDNLTYCTQDADFCVAFCDLFLTSKLRIDT